MPAYLQEQVGTQTGGRGGGIFFATPPRVFTGNNFAAARTARDTFFALTANADELATYQENQYLGIVLQNRTGNRVIETYFPGNEGKAYSNTQWIERGEAASDAQIDARVTAHAALSEAHHTPTSLTDVQQSIREEVASRITGDQMIAIEISLESGFRTWLSLQATSSTPLLMVFTTDIDVTISGTQYDYSDGDAVYFPPMTTTGDKWFNVKSSDTSTLVDRLNSEQTLRIGGDKINPGSVGNRAELSTFLTAQVGANNASLVLISADIDETISSRRYQYSANDVVYFSPASRVGVKWFNITPPAPSSGLNRDQVDARVTLQVNEEAAKRIAGDEIAPIEVAHATELELVVNNRGDAEDAQIVLFTAAVDTTINAERYTFADGDVVYFPPGSSVYVRWFNILDQSWVDARVKLQVDTEATARTAGDKYDFHAVVNASQLHDLLTGVSKAKARILYFENPVDETVQTITYSHRAGEVAYALPGETVSTRMFNVFQTTPTRVGSLAQFNTFRTAQIKRLSYELVYVTAAFSQGGTDYADGDFVFFSPGSTTPFKLLNISRRPASIRIEPPSIASPTDLDGDYVLFLGLPGYKNAEVDELEIWFKDEAVHDISSFKPEDGPFVIPFNVSTSEETQVGLTNSDTQMRVLAVYRKNGQYVGQDTTVLAVKNQVPAPSGGEELSFQSKIELSGYRITPTSVSSNDSDDIEGTYRVIFENAGILTDAFVQVGTEGQDVLARRAWRTATPTIQFTINATVATAIANNLTGTEFTIDVDWYDAASGGNLIGELKLQISVASGGSGGTDSTARAAAASAAAKADANTARIATAESEIDTLQTAGYQTQSQVDARVKDGVLDWAEKGNADTIPVNKLPASHQDVRTVIFADVLPPPTDDNADEIYYVGKRIFVNRQIGRKVVFRDLVVGDVRAVWSQATAWGGVVNNLPNTATGTVIYTTFQNRNRFEISQGGGGYALLATSGLGARWPTDNSHRVVDESHAIELASAVNQWFSWDTEMKVVTSAGAASHREWVALDRRQVQSVTPPIDTNVVPLNADIGETVYLSMTKNVSITIEGGDDGDVLILYAMQDSTGSRTLTFDGAALDISTAGGTVDALAFVNRSGAWSQFGSTVKDAV